MKYLHLFLLFQFALCAVLTAQTTLPTIFGNQMVLQRNAEIKVWGTDLPNTAIRLSASWGAKSNCTSDANGHWKTTLSTTDAGGPYTLSITGSTQVEFNDILLGEVWVCSGQSNMAMRLRGQNGQAVYGSNEAILNSYNPQLRLFTVPTNNQLKEQADFKGNWQPASPGSSPEFSAAAYFFGRMLQKQLGVPIGLINSSVGGTPAQAWTPEATLRQAFPEFNGKLNNPDPKNKKTPACLYNGMIHPMIPYTIKGVIWYQGEGNRFNPSQYERLFPAMIKSWRERWQQGDFPFYFVQIAPLGSAKENWILLQQAQLKTMLNTTNTGMVVTNDIGQIDCIHPPFKQEVGERLALWALGDTYKIPGILYSGPVYKSVDFKDGKATLYFDHAPYGVSSMGKDLSDFEIAGPDGLFKVAQATVNSDGNLEVWHNTLPQPTAVRYGWKGWFEGSLFNTAGLPAAAFSTQIDYPSIKRE